MRSPNLLICLSPASGDVARTAESTKTATAIATIQ